MPLSSGGASGGKSTSASGPGPGPSSMVTSRKNKEGDIIYSVPYSEHSSFSELILFVNTFRYDFIAKW
jgi:hypothetical protein